MATFLRPGSRALNRVLAGLGASLPQGLAHPTDEMAVPSGCTRIATPRNINEVAIAPSVLEKRAAPIATYRLARRIRWPSYRN